MLEFSSANGEPGPTPVTPNASLLLLTPTATAGPEPSSPPRRSVSVQAKRPSAVRLVLFFVFLGFAVMQFLDRPASGASTPLLIFLGLVLLGTLRRVFQPPRISIEGGKLSVRLLQTVVTPVSNVADLRWKSKSVRISFHEPSKVYPESMRAIFFKTQAKQGCHWVIGGDLFQRPQVNLLRQAIGLAEQPLVPSEDSAEALEQKLACETPWCWGTYLLLAANLLVFIGMACSGFGILQPSVEVGLRWGANFAPQTLSGEWWRVVTSLFIHWGLLHLVFNLAVLKEAGRFVERWLGLGQFLVVYFFSGIIGSLASALFNPGAISAGASGAIFGLYGLLLAQSLRCSKKLPAEFMREQRGTALTFIGVNLVLSLTIPGIDMAAHVGGLAAGFLLGWLVVPLPLGRAVWRPLALGAAATAMVVAVWYLRPLVSADATGFVLRAGDVENRASAACLRVTEDLNTRKITPDQSAARMREEVLGPWHQLLTEAENLRRLHPDQQAHLEGLVQYLRLRGDVYQLLADGWRTQDLAKQGQAIEKGEAAQQVFVAWLRSEGKHQNASAKPLVLTSMDKLALFSAAEERVLEAWQQAVDRNSAGSLSDAEFADLIEERVLPPWTQALERLNKSQPQDAARYTQALENISKYASLRQEGWQLLVQALRENDSAKAVQAAARFTAADEHVSKLNASP